MGTQGSVDLRVSNSATEMVICDLNHRPWCYQSGCDAGGLQGATGGSSGRAVSRAVPGPRTGSGVVCAAWTLRGHLALLRRASPWMQTLPSVFTPRCAPRPGTLRTPDQHRENK